MNSGVDILGKRFRVIYRKMAKDLGKCDATSCEIWIQPTMSEEQKRDTLLHECIHALDHELQTRMNERQVRLIATGLMHWMRANPEFALWIMQMPTAKDHGRRAG